MATRIKLQKYLIGDSACQRPNEHCRGFALIEFLVTIAIIVVLTAIAIPVNAHFATKAQNNRSTEEIRGMEKEIMEYEMNNERLPDTLADLGRGALLDHLEESLSMHKFQDHTEGGEKEAEKAGQRDSSKQ